MDNIELKTEYIPIGDIKPNPRNAKKHPKEQVNSIAASLSEFKLCRPLGIRGEDNKLVYGHGTLTALKKLGYAGTVPCVRLDHLTDEQCRAYALADNMTAELGDWDGVILGEELAALADFGMERFGFEDTVTETDAVDDDYDVVLPEEPVCRSGDVYALGEHRLMCGDSTDRTAMRALMNGQLANLVFTDPPWNVNYGDIKKENAQGYKPRKIANDSMSSEAFGSFLHSVFANMAESSKPGCMTYVVMSAQEWGNLMPALADNGYHWSSTIIWNKDSLVLSRKDYHTKYEPIWYGWKDGPRLRPLADRKQSDVWDIPRPKKSDEHPTMKPIPLVARAISNSSKCNDLVLDTFGGSGSTLIACEQLGRRCYMMELDPKYCDVIIDRWEKLTGKKAEKVVPSVGAGQG